MEVFEILKKYGEYIEYDPEQKSFNLLSNDYLFHNAGNTITAICDRFDRSGKMAVLYAKKIYLKALSNARVKLMDILSQRELLNKEIEMYDLFNGPDVEEIEKSYIEALHQTILRITGKKEIGNRDIEQEKEVVYDALEAVAEQIGKCRKEVYVNSRLPVAPVRNVSTRIHLFNYMADCVLTLENNAPDGAYLCYINNNGTADGYFAIMIKSNGNLFSVNDRVDESYIGQHTRSRNGRWSEEHKDFFPYSAIMTFSDYDYKGYASRYNVDESKLSFSDLEPEAYVPIILAILCVINDQADKTLDNKDQVYINSLMRNNISENPESAALMKLDQTGLIETTSQKLDIHFETQKILDGSYNQEFGIRSTEHANQIIEYYAHGYTPSVRTLSMTANNVLTDGNSAGEPHAEFVGSLERMRKQAYYETRVELANYIRKKHQELLDAFGGFDKLQDWFCAAMRKNIPNMYPVLARLYSESAPATGWKNYRTPTYREDDPQWVHHIWILDERPHGSDKFVYNDSHKDRGYSDYYFCPLTGNKATVWFRFESFTADDIEMFTGQKVPAPLQGWRSSARIDGTDGIFYRGNPILDTVDAVEFVAPLSETPKGRVYFDFHVGFSKRGIHRLMRENGFNMNNPDKKKS